MVFPIPIGSMVKKKQSHGSVMGFFKAGLHLQVVSQKTPGGFPGLYCLAKVHEANRLIPHRGWMDGTPRLPDA